jgi:hypothetical protein
MSNIIVERLMSYIRVCLIKIVLKWIWKLVHEWKRKPPTQLTDQWPINAHTKKKKKQIRFQLKILKTRKNTRFPAFLLLNWIQFWRLQGVIRNCKSNKDRQLNDEKEEKVKKDKQHKKLHRKLKIEQQQHI